MSRRLIHLTMTLTLTCPLWLFSLPANAQLFRPGPPRIGRPLTRQPSPGMDAAVGTLRNQRFIRGNRRVGDFVGVDRADRPGFVGIEQAESGQVIQSAVTSVPVTIPESTSINQPLTPPAVDEMYAPRLVVSFDYARPSEATIRAQLAKVLPSIGPRIEVSVSGQTAMLRGEVASESQRRLAATLCLLEPGVSSVRNDLTIAGDRSLARPPRPSPPPPAR